MKRREPSPTAPEPPLFWHALAAEEALAVLQSSREGLTDAEAMARLERHGHNVLPRAAGTSALKLLFRQIANPLVLVLVGSGVLALIMGKATDAAVVLGVVILNAFIGFIQEHRAERAIGALAGMVPETAVVLRSGARHTLDAAGLVPGDLVFLQSGDRVPADVRLLAVKDLRVVEAALTGESLPVSKGAAATPVETLLADRLSMGYSGTLVTYGSAQGLVVATGHATELGRISDLIGAAVPLDTPLMRAQANFGRQLTTVILVVSILMFGVGILRGYPLLDAMLASITLAVAAIPEGLPAIISIALAIGVQRMAKRKAVVRNLPSVETLGSTTVICSDKTGTLTRNEMTVTTAWTGLAHYAFEGAGYAPEGRVLREGLALKELPADLAALLEAGHFCNDAALRRSEVGRWILSGDPTEGALLVSAAKAGLSPEDRPRLDAVPFESEHQYMATLHAWGSKRRILLKGAPEVILPRCTRQSDGAPLNIEAVQREATRMAGQGIRVLAFGFREGEHLTHDHLVEGFTFLGLQGMTDPPRPEAIEAIAACQRAGIQVKMITGDHPGTAEAVGQALGLGDGGPAITGRTLEQAGPEGLAELAAKSSVFARVAPEHKIQLVRALQAQGQVVAMTGDGVNDAPALKQADIGIAMGIAGTSVSREAADMVLVDDNFATIKAAVEEGRRVYDNLIKALVFVLPTNLGEALVLLVAVMVFPIVDGQPLLPILPVQILWINLVATVTLALPLAFEAPEPDLMVRPPRASGAPLLGPFVVRRTVLIAVLMALGAIGLFLFEYRKEVRAGVDPAMALREAQTMAVTVLTLMQAYYLLACRSLRESIFRIGFFRNPWIFAGIALLLPLQVAFVHAPVMNRLFHSAPLGAGDWLKSIAVASLVLPVVALEKTLERRLRILRERSQ